MTLIVNEPTLAESIRAERQKCDESWRDEVWDGVYIVSPSANNLHQSIAAQLIYVFCSVLDLAGGDRVFGGVNVTDREDDWMRNYRGPDLAVVLRGNPVRDRESNLLGGPDLVVEILSPNDLAREKRPFYAKVGVRELLLVDRDPWALELYRLNGDDLKPAGRSTAAQPDLLVSTVLPLTFRLLPGADRPRLEVRRLEGKPVWMI